MSNGMCVSLLASSCRYSTPFSGIILISLPGSSAVLFLSFRDETGIVVEMICFYVRCTNIQQRLLSVSLKCTHRQRVCSWPYAYSKRICL